MVSCYIHVPFCAQRCGYCDFNTYLIGHAGITPEQWLDGVRTELAAQAGRIGQVATVFFGGGTPSLLGAGPLTAALQAVRETFGVASGAEITVEANPESVTGPLLDQLLEADVTRLSLGMQSGDPAVLAVLERVHQPGQAVRCVEAAHAAGFSDVSVDLIYGTPGETLTSWQGTLDAALAAAPEHVSCYGLIVEPGTPLARRIAAGALPDVDDDLMADEYELADEALEAAGLAWYELSNWALGGHQCRHNLAYWRSDDWVGVGPGAHSHVGQMRWWNHKNPRVWAQALRRGEMPRAGSERLDQAMAHEEAVLLELRLASGLPLAKLTAAEQARLPGLVEAGKLQVAHGHIALTRKGRLLADQVTLQLLA